MNPVLFSPYDTDFSTNGVGVLNDAISCLCTEVLNSSYEIELVYPVSGNLCSEINLNSIIKVKPNYRDTPQPFRVYRIVKDIDGYITVKAAHLCYDSAGIPVMPFVAASLQEAINYMNEFRNLEEESDFLIRANYSKAGDMIVKVPTSFRALMGGSNNSLKYIYGGEFHYDGYITDLFESRGVDLGITIRYGKNIFDFEQESSSEELYTGVFGYWYQEKTEADEDDGKPESVYGSIVSCGGTFPYEKILVLDVSDKFNSDYVPTKDEIDDVVSAYIADNGVGVPKHDMTISYIEDDATFNVCLGDALEVYFPIYNIKAKAKCTTVVFDCLKGRNDSIKIGVVSSNISSTIASISNDNSELRKEMINEARGLKTELKNTASSINARVSDARGDIADITVRLSEIDETIAQINTNQTKTMQRVDSVESSTTTFRTVTYANDLEALLSTINSQDDLNANRITILESFFKIMGPNERLGIKGGAVLGENTSQIKLKLENDIIYFFTGSEDSVTRDSALAYFSSGKLWIQTAFVQTLVIGEEEENFAFKVVGTGMNKCLYLSGKAKDS